MSVSKQPGTRPAGGCGRSARLKPLRRKKNRSVFNCLGCSVSWEVSWLLTSHLGVLNGGVRGAAAGQACFGETALRAPADPAGASRKLLPVQFMPGAEAVLSLLFSGVFFPVRIGQRKARTVPVSESMPQELRRWPERNGLGSWEHSRPSNKLCVGMFCVGCARSRGLGPALLPMLRLQVSWPSADSHVPQSRGFAAERTPLSVHSSAFLSCEALGAKVSHHAASWRALQTVGCIHLSKAGPPGWPPVACPASLPRCWLLPAEWLLSSACHADQVCGQHGR